MDNQVKASQLVASAILGMDYKVVLVNGKRYVIYPPTIQKLAGASLRLSNLADNKTLAEIITSQENLKNTARALSWLINGDEKLTEELCKGTITEVVEALKEAYSLISVQDFTMLSTLARNVTRLTANPRP